MQVTLCRVDQAVDGVFVGNDQLSLQRRFDKIRPEANWKNQFKSKFRLPGKHRAGLRDVVGESGRRFCLSLLLFGYFSHWLRPHPKARRIGLPSIQNRFHVRNNRLNRQATSAKHARTQSLPPPLPIPCACVHQTAGCGRFVSFQ